MLSALKSKEDGARGYKRMFTSETALSIPAISRDSLARISRITLTMEKGGTRIKGMEF